MHITLRNILKFILPALNQSQSHAEQISCTKLQHIQISCTKVSRAGMALAFSSVQIEGAGLDQAQNHCWYES